ncbi:hypothetical protein F511_37880 [Dorcoceras hygrometricum]|uniref:Uncharacterized protein n=1 Tax=Dorcoceras hygrometricum TaxID=472368 RepID=A0A2Z7B8F2_9LAMI|nr:hypothetical protein F511_37880 [Dorcoceras hygrometricum]
METMNGRVLESERELLQFKFQLFIPFSQKDILLCKSSKNHDYDIAIGSVMVAENRLEDCISEDIYQQTSLLYRGSFLPTDIETVQEMFADKFRFRCVRAVMHASSNVSSCLNLVCVSEGPV